ncbi:MAG: dihydroneopterin aldolase [Chthoniobacterales bacterium]
MRIRADARDSIHLEELEVWGRIGVPEEERAQPQRLVISVTFSLATDFGKLGDQLAATVDYAALCEAIKAFVHTRADGLLETLGDALAAHLLATFPLHCVRLEIRKFIRPDLKYVAAIVTRERAAARNRAR